MRTNSKGFAQIILIVVTLILVGGAAYYFGTQKGKPSFSPSPVSTPAESSKSSQISATPAQTSVLSSIDDTWNLYTNNKFGFSIKVPKVASEFGGTCSNGKVDVSTVPVKVFDDNQGAYITFDYFYEYATNNICQKTTNSLSVVDKRANLWKTDPNSHLFVPSNWHIVTASINNDTELEDFIRANWGSGCKLGAKTLSPSGVYDVKVESDGLDLGSSKCPINFLLALKYSPEFKKAATWGIGQDVVFSADNYNVSYDSDMVNSFKFTN